MTNLPPDSAAPNSSNGRPKPTADRAPWQPQPWWLIFLVLMIANYVLAQVFFPAPSSIAVPYTFFKAQVEVGNVADVTSVGYSIHGTFRTPVTYFETSQGPTATTGAATASDEPEARTLSRLQNSLGCGLNSRFPGEHSVVLDCRLRVLGREDSSGEPRSVERRPSTCLHRHRWMTGPGRAPALDRRLADDTLFVTSPGARAGRRSAPARRTCSGTSPSRRRGRGHGDRRTRP